MNSNKQLRPFLRNLASRGKGRGLLLILVVLLSSCSESSRNDDDIPDDQAGIPTSPSNLQGTVYSSTDAELTWVAAQDDGRIMGYEILRDGEPTGPLLDALNYYDPELEPDTSYLYSIVAVDDQDNRSQPVEITLRTEEGPALPTINRANYARLLGEVFDVFRGADYETPLLELESLAFDDSLGSSTLEGHFWLKTYACENDGRADSRRRDGLPGDSELSMHFENCELNGAVYDGDVEGDALTFNADGLTFNTAGLQIRTANDEVLSIAGRAHRGIGLPEIWSGTPAWTFSGTAISFVDAEGTVAVSDATTAFSAGYYHREAMFFDASLSGELTLQSALTRNLPIRVSTPEELLSEPRSVSFNDLGSARDWYFDTGILQLTAEDGSKLTLTPASDLPENVSITVEQGDYSVTFQKPWSSWASYLQIFPVLEEPEFPIDVPAATPVIRMDNYEALVTAAFDVLTGTDYWSLMSSIPWRWEGYNFIQNPDGDGWSYSTKTCDNGGSASTQYTVWDGFFEHGSAEYDDCLFDSSENVVYDGPVAFKGGLVWRSVRSEALTLTQSTDSDVKMAGWLQDSGSFTRDDSYSLRRTEQLGVHAVETDGAVLDVTDATIYWGGGLGRASLDFSANLAGRAIFRSPETDDRRIKVSTPLPFHYISEPSAWNTAWTFPEGRLLLLADDGSKLTLDAGASESGRVQITLSNSDGDAQFDVDWALWAEMLRP